MSKEFRFNRIDNPDYRPRVTEIRRITATERAGFTVIGSQVQGYGMHWDDGLTIACEGDRQTCPRCKKKVPWKWQGYLHVFEDSASEHYFLEMTDFAFTRLTRARKERETFRGLKLCVFRERGNMKAPLAFQVTGEMSEKSIAHLGERSVEDTLRKLHKL